MSDENKFSAAKNVYAQICNVLDVRGIKYDESEKDLTISFLTRGEDIPIQIILIVDEERQLVRLISPMPSIFDEKTRLAGAIATNQINFKIADGSFDYDYREGTVLFKMTSSFIDSLISDSLLEYLIGSTCYLVDEYNDKLLMLSKGLLDLDYFFKDSGE